jgi:ubiquinone/menaquinone biosynthesis C-methylase UbiE
MAIKPSDRVLEIGCGSGAIANLVSSKLETGKITAVDRSATMARLAQERNAEHVDAGRADIRCVAIESADLPRASFDKIFSVNVSLFWAPSPRATLGQIVKLLAPRGELFIFCERPKAIAAAIAERIQTALQGQGMIVATSATHSLRDHDLVCLSGKRPRSSAR